MAEPTNLIVVFGATGFTGSAAATALAQAGLPFAIAGRRRDKLGALRERLRGLGADPELRVADVTAPETVRAAVGAGEVVLNFAGPFARYGDPVVDAAMAAGADYADITGEGWWVRTLIDRHHDEARRRGLRLVPMSGFDSMPSDLGVWMLARALNAAGTGLALAHGGVRLRAGLNGGTAATMLDGLDHMELVNDARLLDPPATRGQAVAADAEGARFDEALGVWISPFVMSLTNTRVVRRSAGLFAEAGLPYGAAPDYVEGWDCGATGRRVATNAARLWSLLRWAGRMSPVRGLMRALAPAPGTGPTEAVQAQGYYRLRLAALGEDGRVLRGEVSDQGDPGNTCTVRMATAMARELVATRGQGRPGGVLTPAVAGGEALVERLRAAGMTLKITGPDEAQPG